MEVSKKIGVPLKSSILMGFSIINHLFLEYPHLWKRLNGSELANCDTFLGCLVSLLVKPALTPAAQRDHWGSNCWWTAHRSKTAEHHILSSKHCRYCNLKAQPLISSSSVSCTSNSVRNFAELHTVWTIDHMLLLVAPVAPLIAIGQKVVQRPRSRRIMLSRRWCNFGFMVSTCSFSFLRFHCFLLEAVESTIRSIRSFPNKIQRWDIGGNAWHILLQPDSEQNTFSAFRIRCFFLGDRVLAGLLKSWNLEMTTVFVWGRLLSRWE